MGNETKIIEQEFAKIPQNMGDYDELVQQGVTSFGVKERVNRYGCEFESIVENNTYAPATLVDGKVTPDTAHWRLVTGIPGNYGLDGKFAEMREELDTEKEKTAALEEAVGTGGSVDERIAAEATARENAVSAETTRAQTAEENLRQLYNSLSQSQPIPVTSLPATGEAGKIYRLAGTTSYADYMYAEGALTTPIKMAEYNNAIDDEPTAGSDNLVKSGGVYDIKKMIDGKLGDAEDTLTANTLYTGTDDIVTTIVKDKYYKLIVTDCTAEVTAFGLISSDYNNLSEENLVIDKINIFKAKDNAIKCGLIVRANNIISSGIIKYTLYEYGSIEDALHDIQENLKNVTIEAESISTNILKSNEYIVSLMNKTSSFSSKCLDGKGNIIDSNHHILEVYKVLGGNVIEIKGDHNYTGTDQYLLGFYNSNDISANTLIYGMNGDGFTDYSINKKFVVPTEAVVLVISRYSATGTTKPYLMSDKQLYNYNLPLVPISVTEGILTDAGALQTSPSYGNYVCVCPITAGIKYHISGKHTGMILAWAFYNSDSISAGAVVELGEKPSYTEDDTFRHYEFIAPEGSTHIAFITKNYYGRNDNLWCFEERFFENKLTPQKVIARRIGDALAVSQVHGNSIMTYVLSKQFANQVYSFDFFMYNAVDISTTASTWLRNYSDWISPIIMRANNSGNENTPNFTGGSHTINNIPTAKTINSIMMIDGQIVVNDVCEMADTCSLSTTENIMAYNTVGESVEASRYVLEQKCNYLIIGNTINVEVTYNALEEITISLLYGIQIDNNGKWTDKYLLLGDKIINATNYGDGIRPTEKIDKIIGVNNSLGNVEATLKYCGLGQHAFVDTFYAVVANAKSYFVCIGKNTPFNTGEGTWLEAEYKFT